MEVCNSPSWKLEVASNDARNLVVDEGLLAYDDLEIHGNGTRNLAVDEGLLAYDDLEIPGNSAINLAWWHKSHTPVGRPQVEGMM